jgi:hypothetical protein
VLSVACVITLTTLRRTDTDDHATMQTSGWSTGMRTHTSGAANLPSEWPTTATSRRSPIAWTTASAYCSQPAESSSLGRSTATASCPARAAQAQPGANATRSHHPVDERERRHRAKLSDLPSVALKRDEIRPQRRREPRVLARPAAAGGLRAGQAESTCKNELFRGVRRRTSSSPTRPVTPEVAGSSPVAPVKDLQINASVVCLGAHERGFRRSRADSAPPTASGSGRSR